MNRPRFSLRALLLLFAAVALFFGVAAVHRRNIERRIKEFEAEGATVEVSDEWMDKIWMRHPTTAVIKLQRLSDEWLGQKLREEIVMKDVAVLGRKLNDAGIDHVYVWELEGATTYYSSWNAETGVQAMFHDTQASPPTPLPLMLPVK